MVPNHPARPFAFLVSTTGCARAIRENLGSAAYSYYFVLEALAPVLERFGTWRLVDEPASRLPFLAARAESEGLRPVHLAIHPLQDVHFAPGVPTIAFPFWEFPDLPARDFGHDTRQNWVRTSGAASLILTACRFTADAFARAGVATPVEVVPVPIDPRSFELPEWDRRHVEQFTCRHEEWRGTSIRVDAGQPADSDPRGRAASFMRSGFERVAPRLDPLTVQRVCRAKQRLAGLRGGSPAKVAYLGLRAGYRRHVRPWLSERALARITETRQSVMARLGRTSRAIDPLLPASSLTLGGLVYTSVFNASDPRKNFVDLLSSFLTAFRDRPDATLVLKLATSPLREHQEVGILRATYRALNIEHRCRVVVITDYLNEDDLTRLFRVTTYYVNTSHAEGSCLPLQRALAGGRPAIAPDHTAMADYMDSSLGFVVRSHPEPAPWPHDPERRWETSRYRLVWSDLRDHFLRSAEVVGSGPDRYRAMASDSRRRMAEHAGREVVVEALGGALDRLT